MFAFPTSSAYAPYTQFRRSQPSYTPFGSSYGHPSSSSYDPYYARELAERQALREEQERRRLMAARQRQEEEYLYRKQLAQEAQIEEQRRYRQAVLAAREEERARQLAQEERRRHHILRQQQAQAHARAQAQRELEPRESEQEQDHMMGNPFFQFLNPNYRPHSTPRAHGTTHRTPAPARAPSPSPEPQQAEPTPEPTPTEPNTPPVDTEALEAAATTLQQAYRQRLKRRTNMDALSNLSAELTDKQEEFTLPSSLDFNSTSPVKVAFTPANAPFLAFEDFLVKLLIRVDEVMSGGDREVKKARKTLVSRIERELSRLDAHKERLAKKKAEDQLDEVTDRVADLPTPTPTPTTATEDSAATEEDGSSECETESTLSVDSIDVLDVVDDLVKKSAEVGTRDEEMRRRESEVLEQSPLEAIFGY